MKYILHRKDSIPVSEKEAINLAKKHLEGSGYFSALYGKKLHGQKTFFVPILMDEKELKDAQKELEKKDPDGRLYVLYHSNLEDKPLYEVEYRKGEAYVDIPEEEINEVIKNRLIEIANSPRLIERYKHELEDLLAEDLQQYANKQFYEEGRGEVVEDSEDSKEILHYKKLPIKIWKKTAGATESTPEDWDYEEKEMGYDFEVDKERVKEVLEEFVWDDTKYEEIDSKQLGKFVEENYDDLIEEYKEQLLNHFKEDAIAQANHEE